MARKSSKTAHVMNLLAGDESESSKSEAAKENLAANLNTDSSETIKELTVLAHQASIQTQEGPLSPSPISIIDMSSSAPDPVSELIRQQLEEEEGFTAPSPEEDSIIGKTEIDFNAQDEIEQPLPDADTVEETEDASVISNFGVEREGNDSEPIPVLNASEVKVYTTPTSDDPWEVNNSIQETDDLEERIESELDEIISEDSTESASLEIASIEESNLESDLSVSKDLSTPKSIDPDTGENLKVEGPQIPTYQYLNVMEHVVKNLVDSYVSKFDTCSCGRCIADITALTLTKLPPKYIVVESNSASPLLNFYINRFSQQVIVELTKACSIVKQNPHH